MKKAALHNLGCKVNEYECECMAHLLSEAGYEIVPFTETADVYVINTCSVTQIADKKSRQMLSRAKSKNSDAIVVAAGCYVQTAADHLEGNNNVDIIISNNKKEELVRLISEYEKGQKEKAISDIATDKRYEDMFLYHTMDHTRAFIKVQDGCNQFCSYCIIPYARGRSRSRSISSVVKEVTHLASEGYKEVVITGIHLSSFGNDTGEKLLDLVMKVAQIQGISRVRFGSFEPCIMDDEFISGLASIREVCPHFHLSLQSGSDTVLKRMNRAYTTEEYYNSVVLLRKYFKNPAITTDVICGFPGESDREFEETLDFVKRVGFYEMHVFKYSKRPGTRAERMPDQVKEELKHERSRRLIELGESLRQDYLKLFEGVKKEVLFEETDESGLVTGFTPEYIKVSAPLPGDVCGTIKEGILTLNKTSEGLENFLMI